MSSVAEAAGPAGTGDALPRLDLQVFTSPTRAFGGDGRTFSPTTSTLICGATDCVLVDAQFLRPDIDSLIEMIEGTGKRLTTIFITHGHGDHHYGSATIASRWEGARVVATQGTVEVITAGQQREFTQYRALWGDDLVAPGDTPQPLQGDVIPLEGHELRVVEVGQADVHASAVLHVPALDAVVAGDVVYNRIHQMLALTGPAEWAAWIASVDAVEALRPRLVVAGHKHPEAADDDVPAILDGTRSYLRDFAAAVAAGGSSRDVVQAMQERYPEHGNLTTLHFSAQVAVKARG